MFLSQWNIVTFNFKPMMINRINFIKYQNIDISTTFRAKNIGNEVLYNPSEDIDNQIKKLLKDFIEKKQPIILDDIAKELNLHRDMIKGRISSNPELRGYWQQVIHRRPIKKKFVTQVLPQNKSNDNDLILKIKVFLENAKKTGTPISSSDILPELEISRNVFGYRIKENPELLNLWNSCKHRKNTVESLEKKDSLNKVLQDCVNKAEYINYHELSKRTGLSEQACKNRIMRDKDLLSKWNILKNLKLEEKSDINKRIGNTLSSFIKRGMILEIDKIAKQAGLDIKICKHKIDEDPDLFKLWQTGLHKRTSLPTKKESEAINNKIKEILEDANRNGISMRNEDIAKKANIKAQVCYGRLKRFPELHQLWKENNNLALKEYEKVNLIIKKEIEKAILEEHALGFNELSKLTGLSMSLCANRIYTNKDLKTGWDKVQKIAEEKILRTIEFAILNSIEKNEKITYKILEKNYGITPDVLQIRLKENPKLKIWWDKADHVGRKPQVPKAQIGITKFQQALINDEKIADLLLQAINEGIPISQKEIAKEVGITQGACKERIRRVSSLNDLWQKVKHKKISDTSIKINNKIKTILQNTLDKNEDISIEQLAKEAGISKLTCAGRLRIHEELNTQWNQIKENREILIKQIANLKMQGASDIEIQKELGLNTNVFNELITTYTNIKRMILSHSDKNITNAEYIKWATLTKREFELAVTKLFEKIGYKAGATRYIIDGGVDVIASKDSKKTYIECVHNLERGVKGKEILALQGCKYYYGADDVILVASSGLYKPAKHLVNKINERTDNKFRVMVIEDIIKMAKKYKLDIDKFNDVKNVNHKLTEEIERKKWLFKKIESVTEGERNEWHNLPKKEFIFRVQQLFKKQNYTISPIEASVIKNSCLLEKNGEKSILQYIQPSDRNIDDIRSLYGVKDVFGAKKVIAFGLDSLSHASQDFINNINKTFGKECTFSILSTDKIISLCKKLK